MADFSQSTATKSWITPHMSDCPWPACIKGEHDRHEAHEDPEGNKFFGECLAWVDEGQWTDDTPCTENVYDLHLCVKDEDHDDDHVCVCGATRARTGNAQAV